MGDVLTVTVIDVVVVVSRTVEVHGAEVKQTIIASGVPSSLPPKYISRGQMTFIRMAMEMECRLARVRRGGKDEYKDCDDILQ